MIEARVRLTLSEPTGREDGVEQIRRTPCAGVRAGWGRGEHFRHCLQHMQVRYLTETIISGLFERQDIFGQRACLLTVFVMDGGVPQKESDG